VDHLTAADGTNACRAVESDIAVKADAREDARAIVHVQLGFTGVVDITPDASDQGIDTVLEDAYVR
jgi:hypothetical protein